MITRLKQHPYTDNSNHNRRILSSICAGHGSFNSRRWNAILTPVVSIMFTLVAHFSVQFTFIDAAGNNDNKNKYYPHSTPENTRLPHSSSSSVLPPPPPPPQNIDPFSIPVPDDFNNDDPYWGDETQSSLYNNNDRNVNDGEVYRRSPEFDVQFDDDNKPYQQRQQGRPPFQPIPSQTSSSIDLKKGASTLPSIHYSFPQRNVPVESTDPQAAVIASNNDRNNKKLPSTASQDQMPKYASARQDVVTRYIMESYWNRCYMTLSAAMVGCLAISFLGQSLLGHVPSMLIIIATSILFSILTWLRNNIYGELIRAISLTIIFTFQRSIQIRNQYPAHQYLFNAIIGDTTTNLRRRRQPFPPTNNPWTWSSNVEDNDVEFQMIPTVIAMAFIGSVIGTNIPILPSSFGALLGAAAFAYTTTLSSSRGDLCRCMGMRIVAFVREFITIANTDLHLPSKSAVVASAVLDKLLILDRQHSIRQRIGSAITSLIDTVSRIQRDMQQQQPSAPSSTDNVRTSNDVNPRRRPYNDDGDIVRNDDDYRPKHDDDTYAQPKMNSDDRRNVDKRERKISSQQSQKASPPRENKSGGWFSIFPGRASMKTNHVPRNSDVTTNIDSREQDGTFPNDDVNDNGWDDNSNVF